MNTLEQLSKSLLAACKAAGIESPRYIAQDQNGFVHHYHTMPTRIGCEFIGGTYEIFVDRLNHPPYAEDWQDSLLEWVDHVADTSKKIDDACKLGYRKMIAEYAGRRTEAQVYERAWQDALAWKGGQP